MKAADIAEQSGVDLTPAGASVREALLRLMEDSEFREEYARADDEFALIEALVRARAAAKLTQAELARRLGTTQSAVARHVPSRDAGATRD